MWRAARGAETSRGLLTLADTDDEPRSDPMRSGLILDSGVLQGLAKERPPVTLIADRLRQEQSRRLVTIREVTAECIDVHFEVLSRLNVLIEPTRSPSGMLGLLDAFSSGPRVVPWSLDLLPRADRAVVGHAIACSYDIVTTDAKMRDKSFREFLKRLDGLPEAKIPRWRIPEIIVVRRGLVH